MIKYGFIKETAFTVEELEGFVNDELKKEGFGVISKVDMSAKFKDKLGEVFRKYLILGACNPPVAFDAVHKEENIGLLLPCNIIIYETDKGANVGIIKPSVAMAAVENKELEPIAHKVEVKLKRVFDNL